MNFTSIENNGRTIKGLKRDARSKSTAEKTSVIVTSLIQCIETQRRDIKHISPWRHIVTSVV